MKFTGIQADYDKDDLMVHLLLIHLFFLPSVHPIFQFIVPYLWPNGRYLSALFFHFVESDGG